MLIKQTPDSLGYVELIYAIQNKMGMAASRTLRTFVKADLASVSAAAAAAAKSMPDDFRVSITNPAGKGCLSDIELHLATDPSKIADDARKPSPTS